MASDEQALVPFPLARDKNAALSRLGGSIGSARVREGSAALLQQQVCGRLGHAILKQIAGIEGIGVARSKHQHGVEVYACRVFEAGIQQAVGIQAVRIEGFL